MGTRREFRIFYRKSIDVLSEITSGNIEKEMLKLKESVRCNKWGLGILKDSTSII